MNDSLLMGMIHRITDGRQQLKTLVHRQSRLADVICDGSPADQFHREVRLLPASDIRRAGFKYSGDAAMIEPTVCRGFSDENGSWKII